MLQSPAKKVSDTRERVVVRFFVAIRHCALAAVLASFHSNDLSLAASLLLLLMSLLACVG
jgi:hypothetical protein